MTKFTYSVVIPSWKGIPLLKKNLPAVLNLSAEEVIIVDDFSPDNDIDFLKQNFPQVKVSRNERNYGFGTTVNRGVAQATTDIVVLLNLDVNPAPDLISRLNKHFQDPRVFAVSFAEQEFGPNLLTFTSGYLTHTPIQPTPRVISPTLWVSGGSGAFRRQYWHQIGGLDPIYDPFYWEDIDLCFRASQKGWLNLWDPQARVEHVHESTIGKHVSPKYKKRIQERNHLIFTWKYLSFWQWPSHLLHLTIRLIKHPGYAMIVGMALARIFLMAIADKPSTINNPAN